MSNNYEQEIREMISSVTHVPAEKITLDANFFTDLDIDSLKAIEIVAAFEKKYRIIIPENEVPGIRNLKDVLEYTKGISK